MDFPSDLSTDLDAFYMSRFYLNQSDAEDQSTRSYLTGNIFSCLVHWQVIFKMRTALIKNLLKSQARPGQAKQLAKQTRIFECYANAKSPLQRVSTEDTTVPIYLHRAPRQFYSLVHRRDENAGSGKKT